MLMYKSGLTSSLFAQLWMLSTLPKAKSAIAASRLDFVHLLPRLGAGHCLAPVISMTHTRKVAIAPNHRVLFDGVQVWLVQSDTAILYFGLQGFIFMCFILLIEAYFKGENETQLLKYCPNSGPMCILLSFLRGESNCYYLTHLFILPSRFCWSNQPRICAVS